MWRRRCRRPLTSAPASVPPYPPPSPPSRPSPPSPALGKPTMPMSATTLNTSCNPICWPGRPLVSAFQFRSSTATTSAPVSWQGREGEEEDEGYTETRAHCLLSVMHHQCRRSAASSQPLPPSAPPHFPVTPHFLTLPPFGPTPPPLPSSSAGGSPAGSPPGWAP